MNLLSAFTSDPQRYEGVRPFHVWGLRVFYFLMLVFVATDAWGGLLTHEGPWDPVRAVAVCVWATYPTLAVFGLIHPLRWLPLMFFTSATRHCGLASLHGRCGETARSPVRPRNRSRMRSSLCRC